MRNDWSIKPLARMDCDDAEQAIDELAIREEDRAPYRSDSLAQTGDGGALGPSVQSVVGRSMISTISADNPDILPGLPRAGVRTVRTGGVPRMDLARVLTGGVSRFTRATGSRMVPNVSMISPVGMQGLGAISDSTKRMLWIGGGLAVAGILAWYAFKPAKKKRTTPAHRVTVTSAA